MRRGPASPLPSVRCCIPALGCRLVHVVVHDTDVPADLDSGQRAAANGKDGTAVRYVIVILAILAVLYLYGLSAAGP